jgi:hypothetical protein
VGGGLVGAGVGVVVVVVVVVVGGGGVTDNCIPSSAILSFTA